MIWKTTHRDLIAQLTNTGFQKREFRKGMAPILVMLFFCLVQFNPLFAQKYIPILDPPGRFEIDGNLTAKDVQDGVDWAPFWNGTGYDAGNNYIFDASGNPVDSNTSVFVRDPFESNNDYVFKGGNKYTDDPLVWKTDRTQASPAKGDMSTAFYHITRNADGDQWLFVGSDRISNNGTSYLDFEFFQGNVFYNTSTEKFTTTNTTGKARTEGDFLISVKYENGGSTASVQFFIWENNAYVDYTSIIGANDAFAAGNTIEVKKPFTPDNAAVYDTYLFVEAGLNMTRIFGGIAGQFCDDIELESLLVKTKTSASDSATLIDFIGPVPVDIFFGAARISYDPNPVCEDYEITYEPTIEGVQNGTFSASPGGLAINTSNGIIDIAASAPGTYTVTYTFDSYGCIGLTSTYDITISPVPGTPVTTSDYQNGNFNQCFSGQILDANDAIIPASGTSLLWYTSATGNNTTNSPTLSQPGTVSYYAVAIADSGDCTNEERTEVFLQLRDKPDAVDDQKTTDEDTAVIIDVLNNDTDPENDNLTVTNAGQPANGTTEVINNQVKYTPNANYFGTDTFEYTITDSDCGTDTALVTVTVNSVNDLPNAEDDTLTVEEDSKAGTDNQVDVSLNDNIGGDGGDADNFSITSQPSNGTVSEITDGVFQYIPDANFNGSDSFTYTITDVNGDTDTATVTVTVNSVNDVPVANNDNLVVNEDSPAGPANQVNVASNDNIGGDSGDGEDFSLLTSASNGTVTEVSDGLFQYVPDPDYNGPDSFTYTITDKDGDTDTATVFITVNPVNDTPTANDDVLTVEEDSSAGPANQVDVSANDDIGGDGGDANNFALASQASNGTVTEITDGVFQYIPAPDFFGQDSFTYTITDKDGDTDSATVNITVNSVNDTPSAENDALTVEEDSTAGTANQVNVASNDDIGGDGGDSDNFSLSTAASNGTVTEISDGVFQYIPNADYNGPDSFTYTITDVDGDTATATVFITVNSVNDVPVANNDNLTVDEDSAAGVSNQVDVSANDNIGGDGGDADNYSLTTSASNGTVTEVSDGVFQYVPDTDFNGSDSFTYTITDIDGDTDTATVSVTVNSVNDTPTAQDDSLTVQEDSTAGPSNRVDVTGNDDVGGDGGDGDDFAITTQPTNGTVSEISDGVFEYIPDPNFNGSDSFTYSITDADGDSETATVSVTVVPVNDPPVALDDIASTDEDQEVDIDVLANDSDIDGNDLDVSIESDPSNGTATVNTDGTIKYIPDANFNGQDSFTYTISDGNGGTDSATVQVFIGIVNDPPVAVNDEATTPEDTPVDINVVSNDQDTDGDDLTVFTVSDPDNGSTEINDDNTIKYTPDLNFYGEDTFTYTISDGNGGTSSATVTVTVTPVNDDPVAVNDPASTPEDTPVNINVLANDTDVDGDTLEVIQVSDPDNGTTSIDTDGTVIYIPDPDYFGEDTFTYTISDGNGGTATAIVTVTVTPVDDAPTANDDTLEVDEDSTAGVANQIDVSTNDDIGGDGGDDDNFSIKTQPENGTVSEITDGVFQYIPDADFNGEDSFTYTITDVDGDTDSATVSITVADVDDVPVAVADTLNVDEDSTAGVSNQIDVSANDNIGGDGGDGDDFSVSTLPTNGTVTELSDGIFEYIPDPEFNGSDSFTYTITDIDGDTDSATVTITVNSVNDLPVANDDSLIVDEDSTAGSDNQIDVSVNDNIGGDGGDGDNFSIDELPSNGTLTEISDGVFEYVPNPDFNGTDSFSYLITDVDGDTDSATVSITVNSVDDLPEANDDTLTVEEDSTTGVENQIDVSANDNIGGDGGDDDNYSIKDQPANGSVTEISDGIFEYIPNADYNGADSFTYNLTDVDGDVATATVQITVNSLDDAPTANDDTLIVDEDSTTGAGNQVNVSLNDEIGGDGGDTDNFDLASPPAHGTVSEITDGLFEYIPDPNYNGPDSFTYTITDTDGTSSTGTVTVTVNPVNDAPEATDDIAVTEENSSVDIPVLDNDEDIDGDTLEVIFVSDPPNGTTTTGPDGVITYTPDPGFTGEDTFTYTVSDGNGGEDTGTVTVFVSDESGPEIVCPVIEPINNDNGICGAVYEFEMPVFSDNSGNATMEQIGGPSSGDLFPVGDTVLVFKATDEAGNFTICSYTVTVLDAEAPVIIACVADISVSSDAGLCTASEVNLGTLSAEDNCDSNLDITNDAPDVFPVGETVVTWTVTDDDGNFTTCSQIVTVTDDQDPEIEEMQDIVVSNDPGECGAIVTYDIVTATDNCEISTITVTEGPASGTEFEVGTTTVTYTVTDINGNSTTESFTVTVNDTETPELNCPGNITVSTTTGESFAIVTFMEATVTDNCGATIEQTAGPVSGSQFSLGTTTVTFTATDDAGNTTECSFTVTVEDDSDPTLECPSDISQNVDAGECGAVVTFTTPEAFDNSGNVTVEQTSGPASGEQFPVGTTTVTFTATDDAGNSVECSFTVTVSDDEAPVMEDMVDINVNNDPGACGAIVNFDTPGATDNCGIESVVQTDGIAPGSEFPVGTTTVEYTATDTAGNTTTTTFTVTVTDNESPAIECPENITLTAEFNSEFLVVTYDEITVSDNCEGTTIVITEGFASGEEFPVGETTTVRYSITDSSGNNVECEFTVTITEDNPEPPSPPAATISAEAICEDPFGIITVETQEGLTYSIDGENYQESGVFTDLEPGTYEVTAKDEFDQVSAATIITIDPPAAQDITLVNGGFDSLCIEDSPLNLFELFTGEYDDTGTWIDTDNSGALDGNFVDPSVLVVGATYSFEYEISGVCSSTTTVSISINDDCVVLDCSIEDLRDSISKAVTPNGDNQNDFFTIGLDSGCGFTYDLMIFNRWGAEVYTARNYQNNWDGFSKSSFTSSNQLPSGTYYYILEIRNSEFEPIQGYIYLGTK
ncbi:Ig-like domain-containing protein [Christiangramia sabulilitoris]|uniref:Tandem-95 repeat protein n=1 Tax=Christiangramia sabulilitoris TaxID=2583991 RepID=A0A550I5N8_9FLAO|nr:Ig-like domain-containing protein [Christiangramia sabulilitoris]TRO66302.1 tandem-95 repeat protein [Christiangramia sabulilitoris]